MELFHFCSSQNSQRHPCRLPPAYVNIFYVFVFLNFLGKNKSVYSTVHFSKQFLPLSCLPLYESSLFNFDCRFWNLTMISLCYVPPFFPCCRVLGIFMRTSPIVGGNGNTLKLKTTAKLNGKQNIDSHGLRPIYATFPSLNKT